MKLNFLRMKTQVRALILSLISLFLTNPVNSQVNTDWIRTFNSSPNLVDYGREIQFDNSGNIFVCGHSFVNGGKEGVTTILKYDVSGLQQWVKFTEPGVNMEDFKTDASGNLYVSGDKWNGSNFDILLIKFDNNGNELWRQTYDGGHWDRSFAIVVDNKGNIYQTGIAWFQPEFYNIVTIKYNNLGTIQWNKTFTSSGQHSDYGKKIILDNSGNLYVAAFANEDIAILKYTPDGKEIRHDMINMNYEYNELFAPHIAVDHNDNLIVCGTRYHASTKSDIFVCKYDSSGNRLWEREYNGPNNDSDVVSGDAIGDEALAIDSEGSIFIAGTSVNTALPFGDNVVTLKYAADGLLSWSFIYDGPANDWDRPYSIKVSKKGNVYVCGETVQQATSLVPMDYLTLKLNTNGQLQWLQTFNGVGNFYDKAAALIVNEREEVFVTGISSEDQEIFGGNRDIVTIKYSDNSTSVISNNQIASEYKLYQNFPNPFNPSTKITFFIPEKQFVSLKIFDITGREVETLINSLQSRGEHSVEFNAKELTSGTYFYRLDAGSYKSTKRMTLIK